MTHARAQVILPTAKEYVLDRYVMMMIEGALESGIDRRDLALVLVSKGTALLAVHESREIAAKTLRGAADHIERPPN